MTELTQEIVRELLDYDPVTGVLTWRVSRGNSVHAGDVANTLDKYYKKVSIFGKQYRQHRVIWLWMTGEWPKEKIDHIDRDGLNNVWTNLREVCSSKNQGNTKMHSTNTSGFRGVHYEADRNKYKAVIVCDKVIYRLGRFKTGEEAAKAYDKKAREYFGEFATLNFPTESA